MVVLRYVADPRLLLLWRRRHWRDHPQPLPLPVRVTAACPRRLAFRLGIGTSAALVRDEAPSLASPLYPPPPLLYLRFILQGYSYGWAITFVNMDFKVAPTVSEAETLYY